MHKYLPTTERRQEKKMHIGSKCKFWFWFFIFFISFEGFFHDVFWSKSSPSFTLSQMHPPFYYLHSFSLYFFLSLLISSAHARARTHTHTHTHTQTYTVFPTFCQMCSLQWNMVNSRNNNSFEFKFLFVQTCKHCSVKES